MKEKRLNVAIKAVKEAGDYLAGRFRTRHDVSLKADKSVLLGEDLHSEEILLSTISKSFPSDSFFTEETEKEITNDEVWVFDPLCGSYSYLRGVETWSISAAFISGGIYELGVAYQPLLGNMFYGQNGKGAFMNKQSIFPSKTSVISDAFISLSQGVFTRGKVDALTLVKEIKQLRVGQGSGGELAYVAAGFLDAVIKTDQTLMHFAGGRAIVEAAGGVFIDFTGQPAPTYFDRNKSTDYIATNKLLAPHLLSYINR